MNRSRLIPTAALVTMLFTAAITTAVTPAWAAPVGGGGGTGGHASGGGGGSGGHGGTGGGGGGGSHGGGGGGGGGGHGGGGHGMGSSGAAHAAAFQHASARTGGSARHAGNSMKPRPGEKRASVQSERPLRLHAGPDLRGLLSSCASGFIHEDIVRPGPCAGPVKSLDDAATPARAR